MTHLDERGVVRQDHYGTGRQPWEDILDAGWGPDFAAGNVLKYLRRDKAPEHSLESARWYWTALLEMASGELMPAGYERRLQRSIHLGRANSALDHLRSLLTRDELEKLR